MKAFTFNTAAFAALFSVLFFSSCDKIDKLTQFNMKYNSSVTVPSSTIIIDSPLSLPTPDVQTNSESQFESNNTNKDLVEEVSLTECTLTVNSPTEGDFGFLKSIYIYIEAEDLPEILIASKDEVPATVGNVLELETSGENLREYIIKEAYTLRVKTITDETINADHEIDIESVFHVDAKILGI